MALRDISDAAGFVAAIVDRFASDEDKIVEGGRVVCRTPWIAPMAYLHHLFPPLDADKVSAMSQRLECQLPAELRSLLCLFNGMILFGGSLSIYGFRAHYIRTGDSPLWQPYDLADHQDGWQNIVNRDETVVGGIGPDGGKLVMQAATGHVARYGPDRTSPLEQWPSLAEMLVEEASRLVEYYDAKGRLKEGFAVPRNKSSPWPQDDLSKIKAKWGSRAWWSDLREKYLSS